MLLDDLNHADLHDGLPRRVRLALEFLRRPETRGLEPAAVGTDYSLRVAIDDDDVFALVQRYRTRAPADALWEAHQKYIDVQCVTEGIEMIGHSLLDVMRVVKPYDDERDFTMLAPRNDTRATSMISVRAGHFAIFWPHDAHMPGLWASGASSEVKKIVVKRV